MNDPLLWALLGFTFATSVTPGPNNAMLTASGANFGFRRAVPHMLGIILGFPAMVLAIGLGLGAVFTALPWLHLALKYIGAAYMLYLAWRIATAERGKGAAATKPISFFEAAGFNGSIQKPGSWGSAHSPPIPCPRRLSGLRLRVWPLLLCSLALSPQCSGAVLGSRLAGCSPPIALFGFSTTVWPWH